MKYSGIMTTHTISVRFDLSKCIFCQKVLLSSSSKTNCPAYWWYCKRSDAGSGYRFKELDQLHKNINLTALSRCLTRAYCRLHYALVWHMPFDNTYGAIHGVDARDTIVMHPAIRPIVRHRLQIKWWRWGYLPQKLRMLAHQIQGYGIAPN